MISNSNKYDAHLTNEHKLLDHQSSQNCKSLGKCDMAFLLLENTTKLNVSEETYHLR